jgi:hypothetical protein
VGRLLGVVVVAAVAFGHMAGDSASGTPTQQPAVAEPGALALDLRGGLAVADRKLNRIVRIDLRTGKRRLLLSGLRDIVALAYDDTNRLYVGAGERIYRLDGRRRILLAGTGRREHTGDGGPATAASLSGLSGFEVDHDESIVVAEYDNWIRRIAPDGTITTIAGTGPDGYSGDGGPARDAQLLHPHDVALRADGEVIVADSHNNVLRRIDPSGIITTISSRLASPVAVAGGPGNSLYVASGGANAVVRLAPSGGAPRRVGRAAAPFNLAVDAARNVYVSELGGARRVLRISSSGRVQVLVR